MYLMFMNNKKRIWAIALKIFLLILINYLLSELLIIFDSCTNWYANYDVELFNLVFLVKIFLSIIIIFYNRKKQSDY